MRQAQSAAVMAGEKLCWARATPCLEPKQLLQINVHACADKHGGNCWHGVRQAQPAAVMAFNGRSRSWGAPGATTKSHETKPQSQDTVRTKHAQHIAL